MQLYVPKFLANKDAIIKIADGTDENGALNIVNEIEVKCRFEHSNSVTYTKEGAKITLKGKVFVFDKFELFPNDVSGYCTVCETKYDIVHSSKKFNPDGSINHIVLELI